MPAETENDGFAEAQRRIEEALRSNAPELDLSSLNLGAIPESLAQLANLQILDLYDNQITAIPDSLAQLVNLQSLDLYDNQITAIPESLALLANLQRLDLYDNQITAIPDSLARLANLQRLHLSDNQITAIPDSLAQLPNLQSLYLYKNQITAIPDSLAQLANLQKLYLHDNQITAIPDSLAQLVNLQSLDLSHNQITTIPGALAQLANLQRLHLSDNQITAIPASLAQLANLQRFDLYNNQITAIPDSLAQLVNLQRLDLSHNQIAAIPDSLAQLANLQRLDLSYNQITAIPEALQQMKTLTTLVLHGNPGLAIPDEILGAIEKPNPAQEILRYYFAQREGSRPLNEGKLILVGSGGVGKTSLVKTLITGRFNPREKTTEGIKISDWSCPLSRHEKITLHVWDFGGQEMMHATHQFFLTQRSVYLLVLSRRQGGYDEEADYWLRMIRAFGGNDAPVIVVLNKQKQEPFDVNRGGWLEKYADNIRAFVVTDCADKKSVAGLRKAIQEQLRVLQSLKAAFPARWFAIKDELAHMSTDYVTFQQYKDICAKHGESDAEAQTSLSGFLHDLGIALNYRDDPRLRFGYVLKPEWVTGGMYALLHAFVKTKGLFAPSEAESVLNKNYPPEAVHFILGLMEQFELSFPLRDPKKRILIPELLDDQQPVAAGELKAAECLNFGYRYPIVPGGLLPRFIVRTHHLSDASTRWKSGVILRHETSGCRALVRTDSADRQVRIHIDGPEPFRRDLLAVIRHNFEAIHADYEFKPEELVYPVGVPDKPLNVDELKAMRQNGIPTTPVVLSDKTVIQPEIAELLAPVDAPRSSLKLFLSYSHKDEKFIEELRKDLKLMERNGLIQQWYDRQLSAGEKWEPRILQELESADIIVCQLSRDFLASDFCVLTELATAIRRKEAGEAGLIAYVLKDCGWKEVPRLKEFQILPRDAKPIQRWPSKDTYWRAIAEGIKTAIEKLPRTRSISARKREASAMT
jgi:internalin A